MALAMVSKVGLGSRFGTSPTTGTASGLNVELQTTSTRYFAGLAKKLLRIEIRATYNPAHFPLVVKSSQASTVRKIRGAV